MAKTKIEIEDEIVTQKAKVDNLLNAISTDTLTQDKLESAEAAKKAVAATDKDIAELKEAAEKEEVKEKRKEFDNSVIQYKNAFLNQIDQELSQIELGKWTKEMADRRQGRELKDMEKEITDLESKIGFVKLQIADVDKEIEEKRAGISSAESKSSEKKAVGA